MPRYQVWTTAVYDESFEVEAAMEEALARLLDGKGVIAHVGRGRRVGLDVVSRGAGDVYSTRPGYRVVCELADEIMRSAEPSSICVTRRSISASWPPASAPSVRLSCRRSRP